MFVWSHFCISLPMDSWRSCAIFSFFLSLLTVNETYLLMPLWTRPECDPLQIQIMTAVQQTPSSCSERFSKRGRAANTVKSVRKFTVIALLAEPALAASVTRTEEVSIPSETLLEFRL